MPKTTLLGLERVKLKYKDCTKNKGLTDFYRPLSVVRTIKSRRLR